MRPRRTRTNDSRHVEIAVGHSHPGHWHDHLRSDRRKQIFQKHQQSDANISHLLHLAGNPVSHILSWCVGGPVLETVKKNRGTARTGCWDRRSEERRVGKECVSTCRSRWSPDHETKNNKMIGRAAYSTKGDNKI